MRATRLSAPVVSSHATVEIERLQSELTSYNERITELERQHPEASKLEALKASALLLARRIDELRCPNSTDLTELLAK
ncbi:hypothetical protein [Bradyrhizobium cenepequi]|uniref:hypothetical protein n=1 Tax=Bradyrhizobium cenepequi TaxID=2821403 RepID=UPI001CE3ABAC|nr:hypothetical protein [Bradyrhizobium cenepequi]MCA6105677.1 hypothetical protein [Bradyrhizobium cenepequi]